MVNQVCLSLCGICLLLLPGHMWKGTEGKGPFMFKASSTDLCFVLLGVGELVYLTFSIIGSCNSTRWAHPHHLGLTDASCIQNAINLPGEGGLFPPLAFFLWDSIWFVRPEKNRKVREKWELRAAWCTFHLILAYPPKVYFLSGAVGRGGLPHVLTRTPLCPQICLSHKSPTGVVFELDLS